MPVQGGKFLTNMNILPITSSRFRNQSQKWFQPSKSETLSLGKIISWYQIRFHTFLQENYHSIRKGHSLKDGKKLLVISVLRNGCAWKKVAYTFFPKPKNKQCNKINNVENNRTHSNSEEGWISLLAKVASNRTASSSVIRIEISHDVFHSTTSINCSWLQLIAYPLHIPPCWNWATFLV